jgi:hypothetical protein
MNRHMPRVPAESLGGGKPLVQVKPAGGKLVPAFGRKAVGTVEHHDLVAGNGRPSLSHCHDVMPV